jgi:hypothetical protein
MLYLLADAAFSTGVTLSAGGCQSLACGHKYRRRDGAELARGQFQETR